MSIVLNGRRYDLTVRPVNGGESRTWSSPSRDGGEGLRITFSINKSLSREPNTAQIKIFNLSDDSRSFVSQKGLELVLDAGYGGIHGRIFTGQTQLVFSKREGIDWVTQFELGDGLKYIRGNTVGLALGGKVTLKEAIHKSLTQMGAAIGVIKGVPDKTLNGLVHQGDGPTLLDKLTRVNGLQWSIQDGVVQVHPAGEPAGPEIILISPDSGLIGSPERFDKTLTSPVGPMMIQDPFASPLRGIKFKSLLIPALTPGMRVQVESAQFSGLYRCCKVTHTGDSRGGEWYSQIEGDVAKSN